MRSLAIWYEQQTSVKSEYPEPELDLHFNHWKLKPKKQNKSRYSSRVYDEYFMDVGIRVKNGQKIKNICFHLPYRPSSQRRFIEDLGNKLESKSLLAAVFNDNYDPKPVGQTKFIEVSEDGDTLFYIYKLDIEADISCNEEYEGITIKFPFRERDNLPTYYRFRLLSDFVKEISLVYKPKTTFLESAFSSIEVIDFRLNDTRNLNISLLEHIATQAKFRICLIHFFVIRNIRDEYITSHENINNVRLLEESIWNAYIPDTYVYNKSLAYHLKRKVSDQDKQANKYIEDFVGLLQFRFEDSRLFRYFLYLVAFALISEVIGSALYDCISPYLTSFWNWLFTIFRG